MRIDRSASFVITLVVGVSLAFAGCGSDSDRAQVSPAVQKKTEEMLSGMQKKMQDMHQADKKASKKGR